MVEKVKAFDAGFLAKIASTQGAGQADSVNKIVDKVIDTTLYVAGALAIIYLIYSGILYLTSAGNPDSAKKGQQGVLNAVIGIIIIVLAYYLATAIAQYAAL